jgi:TonB family protein
MFEEMPLGIEPSSRARAGLAAISFHLAIVFVAVHSTRGTAQPERRPILDTVRIELPPPPTMPTAPSIAPREQFPMVPSAPTVPRLPLESPRAANLTVDFPKLDQALTTMRSMISSGSSGRDGPLSGDTAAVLASEVDHLPELLGDLKPRYPEELRRTRVSGETLLEYVIDSKGRVVSGSIRVIHTSHPAFARSVIESLLGARFNPARRAGRSIAVVVRQRIRFESRQSF